MAGTIETQIGAQTPFDSDMVGYALDDIANILIDLSGIEEITPEAKIEISEVLANDHELTQHFMACLKLIREMNISSQPDPMRSLRKAFEYIEKEKSMIQRIPNLYGLLSNAFERQKKKLMIIDSEMFKHVSFFNGIADIELFVDMRFGGRDERLDPRWERYFAKLKDINEAEYNKAIRSFGVVLIQITGYRRIGTGESIFTPASIEESIRNYFYLDKSDLADGADIDPSDEHRFQKRLGQILLNNFLPGLYPVPTPDPLLE
jgi:hypothetical protein